jgi:hypothetical protein
MQPHLEPMLVLDPAMLIDSALQDEDSDYEYEYDEKETEVYSDLTHHNHSRESRTFAPTMHVQLIEKSLIGLLSEPRPHYLPRPHSRLPTPP